VFYEMAIGKLPFAGQTNVDVMHAVLHETQKPAAEVNDKLPSDLSKIIDNALAKEPAERYQAVQLMLEDAQRLSVALRFGAGGVPDGVTTPFTLPKRQSSRNFISRLLSRKTSIEFQPTQRQTSASRETSGQNLSLTSGLKKTLAVLPFR